MAIQRNALILFLFTLAITTETALSHFCGITGCPGNMCCSKWGHCGTADAYCGTGCQNGPCLPIPKLTPIPKTPTPRIPTPRTPTPRTPTPSGRGGLNAGPRATIASVVTPAFFNSMMSKVRNGCPAKGFYTHQAFIEAVQTFPAYRGTVAKREIAAILAQFSHESGSFCFKEEIAKKRYCSLSPAALAYPCQPGKKYYGRGPIQITWNYNYGEAGRFLGLPLLRDPDMVARNPTVAFKCSMWFWNKKVRPVRSRGFGATTRAINGGECDGGHPDRVQNRVNHYLDFCKKLGITPGTNLKC